MFFALQKMDYFRMHLIYPLKCELQPYKIPGQKENVALKS